MSWFEIEIGTLLIAAAVWAWARIHPRTKERFDLVMQINEEQQVRIAIAPKTKAGHAARVDGVPVWSTSDPAVIQLQTAADGMSVVAVAKSVGKVTVTVMADADLGEGVSPIEASGELEVLPAQAAVLGLEFGAPEAQA